MWHPRGVRLGVYFLKRRRFLQLSAASLAGIAVSGPFFTGRSSMAAPFGDLPSGVGQVLLPEKRRAKQVLEIFLYGGLSAWETLYMVESYGRPDDPNFPNQQYYAYLGAQTGSVENALAHSYIFAVGGIAGDNVSAAGATGFHPGLARPLSINITNVDGFADRLSRDTVGANRPTYDELMDVYVDQYDRRMRWPGDDSLVRSSARFDLEQAVRSVKNVDAIAGVMEPTLFERLAGESCGDSRSIDVPGMSLRAARHLLTHPTEPAKYVCVSDIGLFEASGGGGYDCHSSNSADTARNFDNLMRNLTSIINTPGEDDPTKINLDDTLIILNTEFGRTADTQNTSGRNHHPYGYVTAFLGGPITSAERGVFGAIGPDSLATVQNAATPAENRVGALLALGIWPFAQEAFAVSDVRDAPSEEQAAVLATERILGISL